MVERGGAATRPRSGVGRGITAADPPRLPSASPPGRTRCASRPWPTITRRMAC